MTKPRWQQAVLSSLVTLNNQAHFILHPSFSIIECNAKTYVNLVSLNTLFLPDDLIVLQQQYQQEGKLLVHLWEDVWACKTNIVISRIKSFLGLNKTIHGRKTEIKALAINQAIYFFNQYHLQGYVKAKYNYGLMIDGRLVAAASFSTQRPMQSKGVNYYSAELIRFASIDNFTVVGGLSKFIKHHSEQVKINDIMTYADRDWSLGKGYEQLGFKLSAITSPACLYIDEKTQIRYFPHRLPKLILAAFDAQNELNLDEYLARRGLVKIFNTGNLKYHFYL